MKILVISDSHGSVVMLQRIIEREAQFDCLVHCGDGVADLLNVRLPHGVPVTRVSGNVDRARGIVLPAAEALEAEGLRILVTHGDAFRVENDYGILIEAARAHGFDLALFGHTHIKYLRNHRPVLFNPGPAIGGSYGVVEILDGAPVFRHERCEDTEDAATGGSLA
ncbi:MAG TPA: YfcE family phosphodiesterase [Spirochaetota bacterium]|nr:YfcE family phosphodiesterase [Spirochaetota bacterium]